MEHLDAELVEEFDEAYRDRLRALQAVDEMVGTIFEELEKSGELDNTYVFYSADNGYHLGQHRAYPGKCTNMEEDINVPFIVRGPGIAKGETSRLVSSHHDIAPTLVALAGGDEHVPDWVDGGVIPLTNELKNHRNPISKESFAVEFWSSFQMAENYPNVPFAGPNTYKTLRVISEDYDYMYAVWCTGEHELYSLKEDPYELHNLYEGANIQLVNRLDALLVVLKSCRAETCRDPWSILHPNDDSVKTLKDALHEKYDAHYTQFKKVEFQECLDYHFAANELPEIGYHYKNNDTSLYTSRHRFDIQKSDQFVMNGLHKKRSEQDKNMLPREYQDLFELVPQASAAGQQLPNDDFEATAIPVPSKLLETDVKWASYNFYSFGS